MKRILLALIGLALSTGASAWDGYDYESGSFLEIESGNLVRSGNNIEIYDYGDGQYHDVEVQDIMGQGQKRVCTGTVIPIDYAYESRKLADLKANHIVLQLHRH